jgi:soluble lytic murein transglycosylase-like protein
LGIALLAAGLIPSAAAADGGLKATSVVRIDPHSGRLVRKTIAPSLGTKSSGGAIAALREAARVDQLIEEAARKYGVDPLLVHAMVETESNYDLFAQSGKGAEGLMQLIPATARRFGVTNSFDPRQNIEAGVRYLKLLQDAFQDDRLALAAYNAGEGAVVRHQWIPPYRETQEYVRKVREKYAELKRKAETDTESSPSGEHDYRAVVARIDSEGRLHLSTR